MDLDDEGHLLGFPQFREAEARLSYLYRTMTRFSEVPQKKIKGEGAVPPEVAEFSQRLAAALDDDLNTAQGVAQLSGLLKATNELVDGAAGKKGSISPAAHQAVEKALKQVGAVLGLGLDDAASFLARVRARGAKARNIDESWVRTKIEQRAAARGERDYAMADAVRDELAEKGIELLDTPSGTDWRLSDAP
jgi:cysteinyl-tRNA synthetase